MGHAFHHMGVEEVSRVAGVPLSELVWELELHTRTGQEGCHLCGAVGSQAALYLHEVASHRCEHHIGWLAVDVVCELADGVVLSPAKPRSIIRSDHQGKRSTAP